MASSVNIDLLKKGEQNYKDELLGLCRNSLTETNQKISIDDHKPDILRIIYEICYHTMYGRVPIETSVSVLSDIVPLRDDLPSAIGDVLTALDTESQILDNHNIRERYLCFLLSCCGKLVPEAAIKEKLEFDTLGDAGIIKLLKNTQTRFIKTKTRLFYKQQKFNLFREESEGFTKLLTELNPETGDKKKAAYVLEVIKSLIGCFNLDPNRVLDIILESFECRPELYEFFIALLRSFSCASITISQVVGFKFSFYQQGGETTPVSLYRITALLLKGGLLLLNQLYGLLKPDDSKITTTYEQEFADAQTYVKQMNTVSTSSSSAEKMDTSVPPENKDEDSQLEEDNQKLGLCAALLDVGNWEHAEQLMACFPPFYAVSNLDIALKLCKLIHVLTDKLYKQYSTSLPVKVRREWKLDSGIEVKEVCSYEEMFVRVFPLALSLGPYLHIDTILMAKLIRLCREWLSIHGLDVDCHYKTIVTFIDVSVLPSLSLLECNCCIADEVWCLLKMFPYQIRYYLYSRWKTSSHVLHPILIKARADGLKRLKYIMKRLSKENVKPSGRHIGKLTHSNPGYLFDHVLSQIQTWDNLIVPVVDSLKYLTQLSYDVLAYCIIEALANPIKERMKHDGTSLSLWLRTLASFSGAVFKKYPIDIAGLLQYVANQIKAEKSLDLLILKEVVQKMAGIESSEEMTPEQIEAMTGGELLRTEGGYFNQLRNVKKSSQRLKEALLEQDLAIPLCLLMAQQKAIFYHEKGERHLKLVGKLYDHCQDTLVQFGSFLASNMNMESYKQRVPQVSSLLTEYYISADAAFFLARPTFNYSINLAFEEKKRQEKSSSKSSTQNVQKYLDAVKNVMNPIVQSIMSIQLPKKNWDDLSPQFYVTFWSLSIYDLVVPSSSYEREITKLKSAALLEENKDANKKRKEKERCDVLVAKLQDEEKMQNEHCSLVMARLKSEKETWFQSKAAKNETITQFLQLCIFPRCIFTPMDSIFCAKFVHLIHCLRTPNFSTLLCYDRIFMDITYIVAACTENEANRYGLFLCNLLETVMRWHGNKAVFDKECSEFPGFVTKFKAGATSTPDTASSSIDHVDYENYRHVCHKWHFKITKALLKCLDSGDFVQIRNALLVLNKVAPHFPVVANLSQALERRIDRIRSDEKEKRPDIYALATGYSGILKTKKSSLIVESDFHVKESHRHNAMMNSTVKSESFSRSDKRETETSHRSENSKLSKSDVKSELRSSAGSKSSNVDKTSASTNSLSSSKTRTTHKETDHNGVDSSRTKVGRVKEEKSHSGSSSPMRREERTVNSSEKVIVKDEKRDRRDDHHEKSRSSDKDIGEKDLHAHRRSSEVLDGDREHKRRRTEGSSVKSPRDTERESRSNDKPKDDEKNGVRERQSVEKVHKEPDVNQEKVKTKDKKTSRKRDHNDEGAGEPRRRRAKTEDDADKQKKDDKSPLIGSQERRSEREDKKHHRSGSVTTVKKRS